MRNFRKFKIGKKSTFLLALFQSDPEKVDFEVEIQIKRHLVAPGGGKGRNLMLTLQHKFIYQSKA